MTEQHLPLDGGPRSGEIRRMFRQQADSHEVTRNSLEYRKPLQQSERQRRRRRLWRGIFIGNARRDDEPMCDPLEGLSQHRRGPASKLDLAEAPDGPGPVSQRFGKNPARRYGVLDGEIDAHTTHG